ncbi:MAG: serine/threonine-protein kinase [Solirubrobacterales bacterium]
MSPTALAPAEPAAAPVLAEGAAPAPGYEVIAHLSRSESLDVYDAWSVQRDCRVVVKLARPDRDEERVQQRLRNEGQLLLALTHPHIVRAYELLEPGEGDPRGLVLILETLEGQTLSKMVETAQRRLSVPDLVELGLQLCSAIAYLHSHGQLHLDLKPSNVIAHAGKATVIDLSLAQPPGPARRGAGTSAYLAPEQASGSSVGPATDSWGIGATLYEAATGAAPFPQARVGAYPQLREPAPSPALARRAPRAFTDLLERCLARQPASRPAIAEIADELEDLLT